MRVAYAGTHRFAELVLSGLLGAASSRPSSSSPTRTVRAAATARRSRPRIKLAGRGLGVAVLQPERPPSPRRVAALLATGARRARRLRLRPDRRAGRARRRRRPSSCTRRWCRTGAAPRRWSGRSWPARPSWASRTLRDDGRRGRGPGRRRARRRTCRATPTRGAAYELLAPAAVDGAAARRSTRMRRRHRRLARRRRASPRYAAKIEAADKEIDWRAPGARRSPTRCARCRRTSAPSPSSLGGARASGAPRPATDRCPSRRPRASRHRRPARAGSRSSSCSRRAARA